MSLILACLFVAHVAFANTSTEQVRTVTYFTDGVGQVNACLEKIESMYGGGPLSVVHYRLTKEQLVECLQLLERYDLELYEYLEDTCKRSCVVDQQEVSEQDQLVAGFEAFLDAQQGSKTERAREEVRCDELRSIYTMFAGLSANMYELIKLCNKWIDAIDTQAQPQNTSPS